MKFDPTAVEQAGELMLVGMGGVFIVLFIIYIVAKLLLKLSLIHISEPTRLRRISYAVFCLKKKKKKEKKKKKKQYLIYTKKHRLRTINE
ncbi:oxaloacetate decarboxylase, gamma chain family protein [Lacticaseibacillus rhamnosus]|nr:oxaloacetate decarboxylase, gamma chain family protein [Lacticaseibacillus rhamnosus]